MTLRPRIATIIAVSMLVLSACSAIQLAYGERYVHHTYSWAYGGYNWTWELDIPQSVYESYSSVPESDRLKGEFNGFMVTTQDSFVRSIANSFRQSAASRNYGAYDEASLLLAWVQSLPYTSDSVTTPFDDFPKFPVETLYEGGGDCEDTTYLYVAIMRIWGYGAILVNPPSHLAAGALGNNLTGYYYEYNGGRYYYAETTGEGFRIGDMPDQYKGVSANLYPLTVAGYDPSTSTGPTNQGIFGLTTGFWLVVVIISGLAAIGLLAVLQLKRRKPRQQIPPQIPSGNGTQAEPNSG